MSFFHKRVGQNNITQYNSSDESVWLNPKEIHKSWSMQISFVQENVETGIVGMRSAQLGALFSIKSHWTVSESPATIVMPTGTGKTETMIATIISEQCKKTLILVPSKLLREQTVLKCASFGVLRKIGVIPRQVLNPSVGCLSTTPKSVDELTEIISQSNIIVSTVSLLKYFPSVFLNQLANECSTIIIDEAHHVASATWSNLRCSFNKSKCLQFTATPFRNDGKKIDGDIIYNFPLAMAQAQGYFQTINFLPIFEFDEEIADYSVAREAVRILEEDISRGLPHIILVRAATITRAKQLFDDIYNKKFNCHNPVLVVSGISDREKQESIQKIKTLTSKILVCVDMFGEGIDIPNLKIAAIHDKYKSLPITLQFVGRFARSQQNLGNATIIANVADQDINHALSELYAQDSDWNDLLHVMSDTAISRELRLQNLSKGFKGPGIKAIKINQLRPKISTIVYNTSSQKWRWQDWKQIFDLEKSFHYVNEENKLLVIVESSDNKVDWTKSKDVIDTTWNLHILYWNEQKDLIFINTSDKTIANRFAEMIFDSAHRIAGETVFRCLSGINRLMFATVGLNSAIDGPIRYKMFAGIDISQGISEAQKDNCIKSNLFGVGYDGTSKISIGCSYKGTIWSRWVESIDYWIEWCNKIGDKLLNTDIDVSKILEGALIPKVIYDRPNIVPYKINWPIDLDLNSEASVGIELPLNSFPIYSVDIGLLNNNEYGAISFYVGNDDFREEFELIFEMNKFSFVRTKSANAEIFMGKNKKMTLVTFFNEYPPTIKFVDQSSLEGNLLIEYKTANSLFNRENVLKWDWNGTNIRSESQGDTKLVNSIQYRVIEILKSRDKYCIIFDDDNAGEIADVVAIIDNKTSITFEFYHCKYSHGDKPGSRINDLYEVCGQAEKSVGWMHDPKLIIDRLIAREQKRLRDGRTSRFEKGDYSKLKELKNRMRLHPSKAEVFIVQPGVDAMNISESMERLLCGSSSYLMETFSISLRLICS